MRRAVESRERSRENMVGLGLFVRGMEIGGRVEVV